MTPAKSKKHLIVFGIVIATLLVVSYMVASKPEPPLKPQQETVWTVDVETLTQVDRSPELDLIGTVESTQNTLITSRTSTTVESTPVLAGHQFSRGDILLTLDALEVESTLIQRQADVDELTAVIAEEKVRHKSNLATLDTEKTMLELAKKAYERQQQLMKNQVTSQERSDTALMALYQQDLAVTNRQLAVENHANTLAQLQARLKRAEAQLALARLDMAQTRLEAPFNGKVVAVHVAAGERIRSGEPLIELVATDSLEIKAQIPDKWVRQVRTILEQRGEATAYAFVYGERIELTLDRIAAAANATTGGIDVYLRPLNRVELPVGKPVDLHVKLPRVSNAYTLPLSSIYGDDRIYLVSRDSRLKAINIERLGRYRDVQGQERIIFTSSDPALVEGAAAVVTQLPKAVTGLKIKARDQGSNNQDESNLDNQQG